MTKDEYCKHALTLAGDERWAYQEQHGITSSQVWMWKRDHADTKKTRSKTNKTREKVLIAQGWACALCGVKDVSRWCLDKTDKVVCGRCSAYLAQWRRYQADGISDSDMEEFIE